MNLQTLDAASTFSALAPEWPETLLPRIAEAVKDSRTKLVVLDDDPTGTQTVHNVPVYTTWDEATLSTALKDAAPVFYILTNSRSLAGPAAAALAQEVGENLRRASLATKQAFTVVSRSDSTLRGHYPLEVSALEDALGSAFDAHLIIPAFFEGGRYTIADVHYVKQDGRLVPAAETPFAQDASFGYQQSNLKAWIEEKTGGKTPAERVSSISIDDLRRGGPDIIKKKLTALAGGVCIVNAASYRDLEVFVLGLLQAEAEGKRFLYRTAASFVRTRSGLGERPLLKQQDLDLSANSGGLVMVGSYVPLSTQQLEHLLEHTDCLGLELNVNALFSDSDLDEIVETAKRANAALKEGKTTVIYTSRTVVKAKGASANLDIGKHVSESLTAILKKIHVRPKFLIAKGGITSSDLATNGLGVRKAMVKGQILPGIPVWQLGQESKFPGLEYIVFPGNVGDKASLRKAVETMQAGPERPPRM